MNTTAAAAAAAAGCRPPFTASQWQELEHQALIFKYLMAGIPVPPDLLLPIRKSLESMAARFYHHPTMGYCSFYGKKMDPEPGRCRRTDGKKWRCSKEAHPDSKYCERHMHRGRNRSRKPVETQNISQPQSSSSSPSSTVTSLAPTVSGASGGSCSGGAGSLPSGIPLQSLGGGGGSGSSSSRANQVSLAGTSLNQLHMDPGPFGMSSRDYGYLRGVKSEVDPHSFFAEASGSARGSIGNDFSLDSTWRLMPSQASYTLPKPGNSSLMQSNYPQLQPVLDFSHQTINSLSKQQQHCFFGNDFDSTEHDKQESQPLRPFFDEWPKTRDSWSELEDDRSNRTSFSTTQLSISIPMSSSDFSTTSSRSPNADD